MDKSFTEFSVFCGSRNPYKVIKNNAAKNRLWKALCKKYFVNSSVQKALCKKYCAKSTPLLLAAFYSLTAQNQRRPL
jgi:hypothetical protein